MAEGKKSFVLYVDLIHTLRKMPKEKVADLMLTIFAYVNDENPVVDDMVVDLVFEPIKHQLKRDLQRWDRFKEKQAENGTLGGRPKKPTVNNENPNNPSLLDETQKSLNVIVNVNDTVTVNAKYIAPADFLKSKIITDLHAIEKNSGLKHADFNTCLIQWSLKCESEGWEYTDEPDKDLKRLRAGFQKWINTWVANNNKQPASKQINEQAKKLKAG
jgi:hypothetical protein